MGHRLSKITTRTGDAGETGLGDGARVSKASACIAALGELDELNSALGVLLAEDLPDEVRAAFAEVQHELFDLGAERSVVALGERETINAPVRQYLNRLSDLLFVAGRILNRAAGRGDVQWRHQ